MLVASDDRLGILVGQAVSDIMTRFEDIVYQKLKNEELVNFLKEQIHLLETKLKLMICVNHSQRMAINGNIEDMNLSGSMYSGHKSITDSGIGQCDHCRELCIQLSEALQAQHAVEDQLTKCKG
ncbi:unnamed protein product [Soboliphyme baturini]|uniref:Rx_N domain-containing protein n=1 Tax=Soboliphyme baturini TaxID=241478 RepID=A0A183IE64_9BILA|nr:unnamed protein product [Soboliphyme baturini]